MLRKALLALFALQLSNQKLYALLPVENSAGVATSVATRITKIGISITREFLLSAILSAIIVKLFADYAGVWFAGDRKEHSTFTENIQESNKEIYNPRLQIFVHSIGTFIALQAMLQLCFRYTLPYWNLAKRIISCTGSVDYTYWFVKAMPISVPIMSIVLISQLGTQAFHSAVKPAHKAAIISISMIIFLILNMQFFRYLGKIKNMIEKLYNKVNFYIVQVNIIGKTIIKIEKYPFASVAGSLVIIAIISCVPIILWHKGNDIVESVAPFALRFIFPQPTLSEDFLVPDKEREDKREFVFSKYRLYLFMQAISLLFIWHYNIHYIIRSNLLFIRIFSVPLMLWFYTYSEQADKMSKLIHKHIEEKDQNKSEDAKQNSAAK